MREPGRVATFALYVRDPHVRVLHANGLIVLTLTGGRISAMTRFDNGVLSHFGLPNTLPSYNAVERGPSRPPPRCPIFPRVGAWLITAQPVLRREWRGGRGLL